MWPTIETFRLFLSLVECYKIIFGMNKLNFDDQLNQCNSTLTNHPYKIYVKPATCNPYYIDLSRAKSEALDNITVWTTNYIIVKC